MKHTMTRREITAAGGAALIASFALGGARGARAAIPIGRQRGERIWHKVRASCSRSRPITNVGDDALLLDAPVRAEDAAVVPIAMRAKLPHTASSYVTKLYLVIDNNPSPISAIFSFTPHSGRADIETRVRVDEYTFVRAIAETSDGRLPMRTRFVRPRVAARHHRQDPQAALASLGKIRMRVDGDVVPAKTTDDQPPERLRMCDDQLTRQFTPRRSCARPTCVRRPAGTVG
jgi:sulfur-oxidizing protein SoxY